MTARDLSAHSTAEGFRSSFDPNVIFESLKAATGIVFRNPELHI